MARGHARKDPTGLRGSTAWVITRPVSYSRTHLLVIIALLQCGPFESGMDWSTPGACWKACSLSGPLEPLDIDNPVVVSGSLITCSLAFGTAVAASFERLRCMLSAHMLSKAAAPRTARSILIRSWNPSRKAPLPGIKSLGQHISFEMLSFVCGELTGDP